MAECNFCGKTLKPGTGTMFVKKDGSVFFFCSRKCRTNTLKLKRNPKNKKWTESGKKQEKKKR